MAKRSKHNYSPRIDNRRARFDYAISDKLECGIQLTGAEVKSVRLGQVSLAEGYAYVDPNTQELWLVNVEISHYPHAGPAVQHEPKRLRKLLAHKREIAKLAGQSSSKGTTLIPLAMYFKNGMAKVEVGVATGKAEYDKRRDIRKQETQRDLRRAMTRKTL